MKLLRFACLFFISLLVFSMAGQVLSGHSYIASVEAITTDPLPDDPPASGDSSPDDLSGVTATGSADVDGGSDDSEEPDCRDELPGALSWAVCAAIDWVDSAIESLINTLNTLLSLDANEVNTPEMRKAWSYFRNMASLLLVIIGLIMIIGQAVSKE